jgi:ABC-type enterochelin transport system permease subunit
MKNRFLSVKFQTELTLGQKISAVATVIVFVAVISALFTLLFQLLWNALAPSLFGLPSLNFWAAWGLCALAQLLALLFGGSEK